MARPFFYGRGHFGGFWLFLLATAVVLTVLQYSLGQERLAPQTAPDKPAGN